MLNRTLLCLILTFSGIVLAPTASAGKIYKWTDEKGQVHFGSQPPSQTKAELVKKTLDTPSEGDTKADAQNASNPTSKTKSSEAVSSAAPSLKDKGRCELARANLESLKTFRRIRVKQDNGEYHDLSAEEKQQQIKESELAIKQACD